MATWHDVGRIVAALPETGKPSPRTWRVRKKLIVWERPLHGWLRRRRPSPRHFLADRG